MFLLKSLTMTVLLVLAFSPLATAQSPEEITVSAAASLTNALQELGKHYDKHHPQVNVVFNCAASGTLLQQLASRPPGGVNLAHPWRVSHKNPPLIFPVADSSLRKVLTP